MANTVILVAKEPKSKRKEYGIVYPDGTIVWNYIRVSKDSLKREIFEAQQKELLTYAEECKRLSVIPSRALIFITRTVTTSYSTPEVM